MRNIGTHFSPFHIRRFQVNKNWIVSILVCRCNVKMLWSLVKLSNMVHVILIIKITSIFLIFQSCMSPLTNRHHTTITWILCLLRKFSSVCISCNSIEVSWHVYKISVTTGYKVLDFLLVVIPRSSCVLTVSPCSSFCWSSIVRDCIRTWELLQLSELLSSMLCSVFPSPAITSARKRAHSKAMRASISPQMPGGLEMLSCCLVRRDTHTQRHTETHRDTQRHIETHRATQRHTETHRDTQRHTETHRDTQRHTETHRDTQSHTEPHRDTQRHTETHRDTQRHTETHRDTQTHAHTHTLDRPFVVYESLLVSHQGDLDIPV